MIVIDVKLNIFERCCLDFLSIVFVCAGVCVCKLELLETFFQKLKM
jgi:hypothetical protein